MFIRNYPSFVIPPDGTKVSIYGINGLFRERQLNIIRLVGKNIQHIQTKGVYICYRQR